MSKEATTEGRHLYGWCMTGDHDAPEGRGGCPVQVGMQKPCSCECHGGAVEPRGFVNLSVPSVESPASAPEESEEQEAPPLPVVGEQIPLL